MRVRNPFVKLVVAAGLFIAAAGVARAAKADAPGHDATTSAATTEPVHAGEAEKNPAAFIDIKRWDLGLWTLVVFGGLFFILAKYAWPKMEEGLEKREATLRTAHEAADQARMEAERVLAEIREQRAKAADEARAMMDDARRAAAALKEQMKAEADASLQAERERARREIEAARDQALQEIGARVVQLATQLSSKVVRREMSPEDHRRLLDEAMTDLRENLSRA